MTAKKLEQLRLLHLLPRTAQWRFKISEAQKRNGNRPPDPTGKTLSVQTRKKISDAQKKRVSDGIHNFWKGGVSGINRQIRSSVEYRLWREAVLIRDKFKCIWCGSNQKLNADHIKPFCDYPELRFAIDNGRTLCRTCHETTPTFGNKINGYRKRELGL